MTFSRGRAAIGAAVLVALVGSGAPRAAAQSLSYMRLTGRVTDERGAPLRQTRVAAVPADGGSPRVQMTDAEGRFAFQFLPPGEYVLRVERIGYRPRVLLGVSAPAGRHVNLTVALPAAPPPITSVDTARVATGVEVGAGWLSRGLVASVPDWEGDPLSGLRLIPDVGEDATLAGRPAGGAEVMLDGFPTPAGVASAVLPLAAVEGLEVQRTPADVEWPGGGGGGVALYTHAGSGPARGQASASWATSAGSPFFSVPTGGDAPIQAGAMVAGSAAGDTARFMGALQYSRLALPLGRVAADPSALAGVAAAARDSGVDLGPALGTTSLITERVSGFGRVDWRVTASNEVSVRGGFASLPTWQTVPRDGVALLGTPETWKGRDATADALLASTLSDRLGGEIRVGFSDQHREPGDDTGAPRLPPTLVTSLGANVGSDVQAAQADTRELLGSASVYWDAGDHDVKAGVGVDSRSESWVGVSGAGRFLFPDSAGLARGTGSVAVLDGPAPNADFRIADVFVYLQDTWSAAPDMEITAGFRYDQIKARGATFGTDPEWTRLSGVADSTAPSGSTMGPRFGFRWQPVGGRTTIFGSTGLYVERLTASGVTEALALDGANTMRRAVGDVLGSWPTAPGATAAPRTGPLLTLLGPGFSPPRSVRASMGISHAAVGGLMLGLRGDYRRTTRLPQRTDLNLATAPVATDQDGRPVYGPLVQEGGLIVAEPGQNRRFPTFDVVSGIAATGESSYTGVTASASRTGARLDARIAYTYSRTTDDLVGAASGSPLAELSPFPGATPGAAADWDQGTSDFDVPHRVAASAFLRLPVNGTVSAQVGGVFRYASGLPFTPGFRPGVDVNGDGSGLNDPAYVDGAVSGMDALIGRWSCLRGSEGAFVERNACRGPARRSLDLRLRLGLDRAGVSGALVVDLLDALQSDSGWIDSALYLVDPSGSIQTTGGGSLSLPLIANPDFGRTLVRTGPARMIRLGFQLGF